MKTREFRIERSKSGLPCMWEAGGGMTNTGWSIIICGPNGQSCTPLYIRRKGMLSCAEHALIPVEIGYHVIKAVHHREDFDIQVYKILEINEEFAVCEMVNEYSNGEWDTEDAFGAATFAARNKATKYHCRTPIYIKEFDYESSNGDEEATR